MRAWHLVDSYRSHYRPLSKERKEIRILHVFPGQGSDIIWSRFKYISLAAEFLPLYEYTTISYCWGDSGVSDRILVNGYLVSVPLSAARVIRRFRQKDMICTIWVDALCIDQGNAEEKSSQVGLMASIYMMSALNFIYLGDDANNDAERTVKIVDNFNARFQKESGVLVAQEAEGSGNRDEFFERWKSLLAAPDGPLEALLPVIRLPWFQRMWVIQEAALSPRNLCFWGDKMWSFDVLLFFPALVRTLGAPLPQVFYESTSYTAFLDYSSRLLYEIRSRSKRTGHPGRFNKDHTSFMTLRWYTQSLRASEPRDFVFALLGIYRQINGLIQIPKWLEPNYAKPVAEVYRDATRHILEEQSSGSVDVQITALQSITHRSTEDITADGMASWTLRFGRSFERKTDCIPFSKGYGNDPSERLCVRKPLHPDILTVKGSIVGRITHTITLQILEPALWLGDSSKARAIVRFLRDYLETPLGNPDDIERKYAIASKVMTAGKHETITTPRNDNDPGRETAALKALMNQVEETGLIPPQPAALPASAPHEVVDCSNFFRHFQTTGCNRSLFVTNGGSLGLGPKVIQSGDTIAIFQGEVLPFVLRTIGNKFQLLGGAYVEELADPEFSEMELSLRWIDIQ